MRWSVAAVHDLVERLAPGDRMEAEHIAATLAWLQNTDDVFRRVKARASIRTSRGSGPRSANP